MKRQHIVLLSIVLLTYPPLCLAKKPKINSHRNNPTEDESVYLGNQAKTTTDFVDITKNDATPSPSLATEAPKKESQFAPGTYYNEINLPLYQRALPFLGRKRDVRGLAEKTITMFEADKKDNKSLGTGDREENTFFFSEVLKSHVYHDEIDKARRISDFASLHQIQLSKEALESATTFFEEHSTALQQEHESLAPHVAKDKDIRAQQFAIAAALERLKVNNPEVKK